MQEEVLMLNRKQLKSSKGQSIVEAALILPVIIILLVGIVDFGLLFNNYLVMTNAAREGTRSAAVGVSDLEIISMVSNITSTLDQSMMRITITPATPPESSRTRGTQVTVTVEYDNKLFTPILNAVIPNPVHLKASTVMMVE
jgi:Flp pilus assembly protein TadG